MKRFLYNILLFLLPLLLISAVLEFSIRSADSYYKQKVDGLAEHAKDIEVLILGSSHAAEGIDPGQFELKAYNMAFGSQTLFYDKRIALKYLNQLDKLKYVVLCVDYHSLYYPHNPSRDIFYHYFYDIDYEDKLIHLEDISFFYFGFETKDAIKQMSRNIETLDYGWFSYDTTYYSSFEEEVLIDRLEDFNDIIKEHKNERETILADVDELLTKLIDHNVTPVIITCPLYDSYRVKLNPDIVRQNEVDIDFLCDRHDIKYWSFLNTHFDDEEYLDNSHLNKSGAQRFGQIINDSLMAIFGKPNH